MPTATATATKAAKLNRVGGRLVSAKSKTGNPACSEAMSVWVRSRHGGPPASAAVFAMLGKCRSMARQNKKAAQQQQSGKLAEGRGTWQRSERAREILAQRGAARPAPEPAPAPVPAVRPVEAPPRLSLRQQAALHRETVKGGPDWARAGKLVARVRSEQKKSATNAKRAIKKQDVARAEKHVARAEVLGNRIERLAPRLAGATDRDIPATFTVTTSPAGAQAQPQAAGIPAARLKAARQALAERVPDAIRAKVLGAIRAADGQAGDGAPVSVKQLRQQLATELPRKSQFDRVMRKLTEEGHLTSHRYDNAHAHGTSPAERAQMVRRPATGPARPGESRKSQESHYNAVSLAGKARQAAAPTPKPSEGGWTLKQERNRQSKPFESTGKGKTPVMFEELRGANARDLPGQRTLFKARPDAKAGHAGERPRDIAAKADALWDRGKIRQAAGDHDQAASYFARHDEAMAQVRRLTDRRASKPTAPPPRPEAAAAPQSTPTPPGTRADFRAMAEGLRQGAGSRRDTKAAAIRTQRAELRDARTSTVRDLPTGQIHFDPERFQYKLNAHSETGSVGSLAGVKKWDPELGGVLQVWKDPANGKTYVVNGHNRLDLAKRLGADKVSVRHITAKDASEARAKGAITNIAEGRGNSTDAAQFFRDTGLTHSDLESRGVPLREKIATEGLALSGLEPGLWKAHKAGELSAARGAILGGSGLTHAQQAAVHRSAGKKGVAGLNDRELREYVDNARQAPTVKNRTLDLFGANEEDLSLGAHRAKAQAHIVDRLGREKRVFGTVARSRNAQELERAGNTINAEESGKVAQTAGENLHVFHTLKNRRGPVADLLNEAAERVHRGEQARKVHEDVYRRLPRAIQEMLGNG